jgi:hypothetical protein
MLISSIKHTFGASLTKFVGEAESLKVISTANFSSNLLRILSLDTEHFQLYISPLPDFRRPTPFVLSLSINPI